MNRRTSPNKRLQGIDFHKLAVHKFLSENHERRRAFVNHLRTSRGRKELVHNVILSTVCEEEMYGATKGGIESRLDWDSFISSDEYLELFVQVEASLLEELESNDSLLPEEFGDVFREEDYSEIHEDQTLCPVCWQGYMVADTFQERVQCLNCQAILSLVDRHTGCRSSPAQMRHMLAQLFDRHLSHCQRIDGINTSSALPMSATTMTMMRDGHSRMSEDAPHVSPLPLGAGLVLVPDVDRGEGKWQATCQRCGFCEEVS